MHEGDNPSVKARRRAQDRLFRIALGVSLLFHISLFFWWRVVPIPPSPLSAAGPRAGDFFAAGGGMESVNLQPAPPRPVVPPRVPVVSVEPVEISFEPELEMDLSELTRGGAGSAEGPPGIEGGRGRGDGGTAAEGFFRMIPPSPRGMIIPPTNKSLRGKEVEVWVFVDATGHVVPDSTRLNPPTSDRGFNRRLVEEAAEWVFNPAMRNNQPIAAWFPYTISM